MASTAETEWFGGPTAERYKEILAMGSGASTSRATVDETLKLLGVSISLTPPAAETSVPDEEKELLSLSRQATLLKDHQDNIQEEINRLHSRIQCIQLNLMRSARYATLPFAVIHFVDLLTKAVRYFEFKEYAMRIPDLQRASDSLCISHILLADRDLMSRFPSVDEPEVRKASHAIYWELYHKRLGNKYSSEPQKDPVLDDPIYDLVFQTREKGFKIDWDPRVELERIMHSDQQFYDIHFSLQKPPGECLEEQKKSLRRASDKYEGLVDEMYHKFRVIRMSSRKRPLETDHKSSTTTRSSRKP